MFPLEINSSNVTYIYVDVSKSVILTIFSTISIALF